MTVYEAIEDMVEVVRTLSLIGDSRPATGVVITAGLTLTVENA